MRPVDKVLSRLEAVRETNGAWMARCPAHEDHQPSLSVREGDDGRVLLHCFGGCEQYQVLAALEARGVEKRDLFTDNGEGGKGEPDPAENPGYVDTSGGCMLAEYAGAKNLPPAFLESVGVGEIPNLNGRTAVRIPYLDDAGRELAVRFRTSLEGDNRFRWRKGSKAVPYGLWKIEKAREAGYVLLVEGESDCHTLWWHEKPAIGIPGASTFKAEWAEHLDGVEKVYAIVEPDHAGEALWERLVASPMKERLYRVELDGCKDASDLHLTDRGHFAERLERALESAASFMDIAETEVQERAREAWGACEELANEPCILDRFAQDLEQCGVAGEGRAGKLLYLALNSRHLDVQQLVNVVVQGPSSSGKSYLVEKVLGFCPEDAYYFLTAMSERALAYSEEPLAHRFLVLAEAAGMSGEFQTYLIRSLLSEGRLRYETVEKTNDGVRPRLIERQGPTGLLMSTTRTKIHNENATRMIAVTVDDTPQHTRQILATMADEDHEAPDLTRWRALQAWIGGGERRVTIPYAKALAEEVPPVAVRLRRDFGAILNLIRSHALLHRATRERDGRGRIVATLEDYAVVRELVEDLLAEGVERTVPEIVRETVAAVARLKAESGETAVNVRQVGGALDPPLDYSPTYRRVRLALDTGYLRNLEDHKGRPARLVVGDPMPEDAPLLPVPGRLAPVSRYPGFADGIDDPPPPSTDEERSNQATEATPVSEDTDAGTTATADRRPWPYHEVGCRCEECASRFGKIETGDDGGRDPDAWDDTDGEVF